ncbi:hypothetical protein TNCV_2327491 [Trichonephila clavipes]|nr:hypothetical protein TNCV_2327491 [Trichonephila clavipes]
MRGQEARCFRSAKRWTEFDIMESEFLGFETNEQRACLEQSHMSDQLRVDFSSVKSPFVHGWQYRNSDVCVKDRLWRIGKEETPQWTKQYDHLMRSRCLCVW